MELTIVESSVFVPPVIVGILFYVYRNSILSINPWNAYDKITRIISNQLLARANQFLEVLSLASRLVWQNVNALQLKTINLLQGPLLVYRQIQAAFQNLTFRFEVVKIQFSNFTRAAFTNFSNFFMPSEKSALEKAYVPILFVLSFIAVGLIWWYWHTKNQTSESPEIHSQEEVVLIDNKQTGRRRRRT